MNSYFEQSSYKSREILYVYTSFSEDTEEHNPLEVNNLLTNTSIVFEAKITLAKA